jgi:trimeric autotransporter adhesin
MKKLFFVAAVGAVFASCNKKGEDVPAPAPVLVAERLELTPAANSVLVGQTVQLTAKYFNTSGNQANLPATAVFSSENTATASVSAAGVVTGVAAGQTNIKISYNNINASVSVNVVSSTATLATVLVTPVIPQELLVGGTVALSAIGQTVTGATIPGLTFNWMSSSTANATVSSAGMVTAVAAGNANITAMVNGVTSAPTVVQVIRQGNFSGQGSTGTAKLRIDAGQLKLATSSNFSVSTGAPDLRIYLTNTPATINGAVQIAVLSGGNTSGMRTWNVPTGISITQYRYALVWCAQFGGAYGVVDFGA